MKLALIVLEQTHAILDVRDDARIRGGAAAAEADARDRTDTADAVSVDTLDAVLRLAPRVLRLALLPHRQERSSDEDRRVRARCDADEQREREVLQRCAA